MPSSTLSRILGYGAVFACVMAYGQDLHIKKNVSVGGYLTSSSETSIKGARERTVTQGPNGSTITLRQCDLRRTITINDQQQTYMVADDPQDETAVRAAALATGTTAAEAAGGKVVVTTTITDTGERKTMYGYQARHLKAKVVQEPSKDACTQVRQTFEIDGWFADISKERSACEAFAPPVQQGNGCHDTIISRRIGSGRPGYPLQENITLPTPDGKTMTVTQTISEISKQNLDAEMFDVPSGYRKVSSLAELNGAFPQPAAAAQGMASPMPQPAPQSGSQANGLASMVKQGMMNPAAAPAANQAALAMAQQQMQMAQASGAAGMAQSMGMGQMGGMPQMGANQATAQFAAPQALGPKAPGKIRIGVAPPDAQVGQGNNAGADYSTPIRNAEVALMNGPAIEIAALDSHVAMQLQAEAQQKQCDYILFSSVAVKHNSGGFGKFAKFGGIAASMTPMGGLAHGMGGAVAAQAAGMAASQMAQQEAMNQLAGFNGQIKSKDDVTVQYQLIPAGQTAPVAQNSLKGKAKSDGEDVLTPLLQQTATDVLTAVAKK